MKFRYYIVDDYWTVTGTNSFEEARVFADNCCVIDAEVGRTIELEEEIDLEQEIEAAEGG